MKGANIHSYALALFEYECIIVVDVKSALYPIIRSCVNVVVCPLSVKRVLSYRVGLYWAQWRARRGAMFEVSHLWYEREGKRQGVETPPGHS